MLYFSFMQFIPNGKQNVTIVVLFCTEPNLMSAWPQKKKELAFLAHSKMTDPAASKIGRL